MANQTPQARRHRGRFWQIVALMAVSLGAWSRTAGAGQVSPGMPNSSTHPQIGSDPVGPPDPLSPSSMRRMEHLREDERHKRLEADTAKLVELTNELKVEIDKASKDELSVDVVKKATEIEKLAHDVRERMKS